MKITIALFSNLLALVFVCGAHGGENTISAKFSALDYFAVIDPRIPRPLNLPERVHFETESTSLEEFQSHLVGIWKIQFSCSSRPMTSEETSPSETLADGLTKPSLIFQLTEQNTFVRFFSKGIRQDASDQFGLDRNQHGRWTVLYKNEDGSFRIYFPGSSLEALSLSLVKIKETGESIFVDRHHSSFSGLCRPGETFETLLTQVPEA